MVSIYFRSILDRFSRIEGMTRERLDGDWMDADGCILMPKVEEELMEG